MTGLRLAILLAGSLALGLVPARAADGINLLKSVSGQQSQSADEADQLVQKPSPKKPKEPTQQAKTGGGSQPTGIAPGATVAEKGKGKGGKKGNTQEFLKIEMKEVLITGRTAPSGPPKGPPSGGLLGGNTTGFNQGGPSVTGAPSAPSAPPPRPNIIN